MNGEKEELEIFLKLAKIDFQGQQPPYESVTRIDIPNSGLFSLPNSLPEAFPNLSILFLSNNKFSEVPAVIGQCPKLEMVAFKGNGLKSIHPDALQPQLRWLILTNNELEELPDTISRCHKLQKLMLSGNKLERLPDMSPCRNLELVRLASNQLKDPPMNLLRLPNLRWVGLSDNPFLQSAIPSSFPPLEVLDIDETDGEILGQGAGGITRLCYLSQENSGSSKAGRIPVACKEFCHSMTSDGLPEEERRINSCLASLIQSPCLIRVLGESSGRGSLVMEYLDNFTALASPPNFESCSRDVYESTPFLKSLTHEQAENLLVGLLEALLDLHKLGIMHGDFYGHNILVHEDEYTNVRLGDFGAAFFYDRSSPYGCLLEEIELRAWKVLAREVRDHVLLDEDHPWLSHFLEESVEWNEFAEVHVRWRQRQLQRLARELDVDA